MKKYLIIFMTLVLTLQIGCKASNEMDEVKHEEEIISIQVSGEDRIILERSENISDYVVELFGVDDAATIIFNDIALVSVVLAYDAELTSEMKEIITDIVIEKDSEINTIKVSNDEKTFFQVIKIIGDMMNGSSYDNYVKEINKLIEKTNWKKPFRKIGFLYFLSRRVILI